MLKFFCTASTGWCKSFFRVDSLYPWVYSFETSLAFLFIICPLTSLLYLNTQRDEITYDPVGTPATHPLEGKTDKKVLESPLIPPFSLARPSGENTVKQDADKPENNSLLLPHKEDIEMKESETLSDKEMEEVETYFDALPTENPSLESSFKNAYGGTTVLLAQDAVNKQMQAQLLAQENANKLLQRQIQLLTQQMQTFMNNQNQTDKLNLIYNLDKLDSDLYLTQDKLILAQKKNTDKLNDKIIQISNTNAIIIKGKMNEDEISKTKINQCNQDLKAIKAEMDLKFHMQNKLILLRPLLINLNHFQDKIDDIQDQIELTDNKLTQDKLEQLTNSQSIYQKKFDDTITSLNNIKINNKDLEDNFKKQVNMIKENLTKYQLSLSDESLQFEYKKLVEKHPKTTKVFSYSCKNNKIFLQIKEPKYTNLVNKLILKSYDNLWSIQSGLNEPSIDNISYYIDDVKIDNNEKSYIDNSTLAEFHKQLEEKLLNEINQNQASSSNRNIEINNKINDF
ncbi:hypothetical protein U3516DRAFT_750340 [Neocallimastix sp. 'constans']